MNLDSLIVHFWTRHEYAVLARSRALFDRIHGLVKSDPPLALPALGLMAEALASPCTRSGWSEALAMAWSSLESAGLPNGIKREDFSTACRNGRDDARVFLFRATAGSTHSALMGSSLFDDEPMPSFAFYQKRDEWWQVREKNGHLSCLPVTGLLNRAGSSARPEAVLAGEGILRRVGGRVYADPRFTPMLRSRALWNAAWAPPRS